MTDFAFPVTLTFIAICAIIILPLVAWVGGRRGALKALHGDAGDPALRDRIRIHGNFIETAPIVIITLGAAEYVGINPIWLWLSVASFLVGRALHALWFDTMLRGYAMLPSLVPTLALGIAILVKLWI